MQGLNSLRRNIVWSSLLRLFNVYDTPTNCCITFYWFIWSFYPTRIRPYLKSMVRNQVYSINLNFVIYIVCYLMKHFVPDEDNDHNKLCSHTANRCRSVCADIQFSDLEWNYISFWIFHFFCLYKCFIFIYFSQKNTYVNYCSKNIITLSEYLRDQSRWIISTLSKRVTEGYVYLVYPDPW